VNIALISVTELVLNKGTDCNEEQLVNMPYIVLTRLVLNRGTV
jgi:hypothetical protein